MKKLLFLLMTALFFLGCNDGGGDGGKIDPDNINQSDTEIIKSDTLRADTTKN